MSVTMLCDPKGAPGQITNVIDSSDACNLKFTASSYEACPFFSITNLFEQYKYFFSLAFIAVGIFICFLGEKLFHIVLFLLTALAVAFVILMFVTQVAFAKGNQKNAYWIVLAIACLAGITAGYFIVKYEQFSFAIVGGSLGGVLGLTLSSLIISHFQLSVF